jgi:hypothetical protein
MTSPAKLRVLTFVALCAVVCLAPLARGQEAPTLVTLPATAKWARECGPDASAPLPDTALVGLRGRNGAVITGVVIDSAGQPVRDARISFSGVKGEWRADVAGGFTVVGIPPGSRAVNISAIGFLHECRVVNFVARDTATVAVALVRIVTKLSTVQIREREHANALRSELDQRRRAGFGYRSDSIELSRLPGVREAFNFPGVRVKSSQGRWSLSMQRGVYSMPSKGSRGQSLDCAPTIWVDGSITDVEFLNEINKEEIALIEVYNSAAGAPMQYAGTRTLCGVVLVWRKRYIDP